MKKIVWISPHLPYDDVSHAGGKIQNYYINVLIKSKEFDVNLISFYWDDEYSKFTLNNDIKCTLIPYYSHGVRKILRNLIDLNYQKNPFNIYGNSTSYYIKYHILRTLKNFAQEGYYPDVIILQWTQVVFFSKYIKKIFPESKIIGIEEDVTFLSYLRKMKSTTNIIKKTIAYIKYFNVRREELSSLKNCTMVILNNLKDEKLLRDNGYDGNIKVWIPYYQSMLDVSRKKIKHEIIFYGDMSRPENYKSAIWFIQKVMPELETLEITFNIIGGRHPNQCLEKYQNDRIKVLGFVDDISLYFSECMCLVAPLLLGAGIKIKVIEAMSAGVPVLTNDIGIEGISAKNGRDYIHCSQPKEYVNAIKKLYIDEEFAKELSKNSKEFVYNHFNFNITSDFFVEWILHL